MISVYKLKGQFQALLRPQVNALAAKGVTANQVTLSAIVISALAVLASSFYPIHPHGAQCHRRNVGPRTSYAIKVGGHTQ